MLTLEGDGKPKRPHYWLEPRKNEYEGMNKCSKRKINTFEGASRSKLDKWDCEAHSVPEQW